MASPPFAINELLPGDSDVVSQHPANARTFRDVVESWLLLNHNIQGRHDEVQLDWKADPGAGTASVTELWAGSGDAGALKYREGTDTVAFVLPPGIVLAYAADTAAPAGWLLCDGAAVSRSTYARLFARIGSTWGSGDGSTTFNLPDLRGRVIAGTDDMGGVSANRLTTIINGDIFAATGGTETVTLDATTIPSHTHTANVTDPGHFHYAVANVGVSDTTMGLPYLGQNSNVGTNFSYALGSTNTVANSGQTSSQTTGISVSNVATGGGLAHSNMQPTAIMHYIIKY